ncbi:MAG: hypothetical protein ABIY37_06375 [Devosia sp.]
MIGIDMPLISLWKTNPDAVDQFSIEQVVSAAGDGVLKDGSICSQELIDYLSQVASEKLRRYIEQCLSSKYDRAGMVLQDLVNELGRRLDYTVENGRYQGVVNASGHDGLWRSPEGQTLIIEVKTTDAYRIALDTIVGYRSKLALSSPSVAAASVLLVVGRQDTGELEAQVRGSRHAWDIRIVSAEALSKLVSLKENSEETETGQKIRSVLLPVEYTRLDRLVDVMFTTASDVEPDLVSIPTEPRPAVSSPIPRIEATSTDADSTYEFTDAALLQAKRDQIVAAVSRKLGTRSFAILAHSIGPPTTPRGSLARSRSATRRETPFHTGAHIIRSGMSFSANRGRSTASWCSGVWTCPGHTPCRERQRSTCSTS